MATMQMQMPVVPESHQVTEIIDISDDDDDIDDDIVITGHNPGRPQEAGPSGSNNANHAIFIFDSDDEQSGPSSSRGPAGHPLRHTRLLSPPPRHIHAQPIPPVPPIPRHLRGHRHAHAHFNLPPPVIVPNPQPFAFEAHMNQPRRRNPTPPILPPRGSARSNHYPAMGLGGALIALNRQTALEEDNRRRQEESARRAIPMWARAASGFLADVYRGLQGLPPVLEEDWDLWHNHAETLAPFDPEHALRTVKEQDTWKPSYTHPSIPQPGFSFDFAPGQSESNTESSTFSGSGSVTPRTIIVLDDDDDSPIQESIVEAPAKTRESHVETSSELVCAHCQDPLVLSSGADVKTEEEQKTLRVWGLRCGHMLDGKCVNALMRPTPHHTDDSVVPDGSEVMMAAERHSEHVTGHGKGKGRAVETSLPDRKGKGKATVSTFLSQSSKLEATTESRPTTIPRYSLRPRRPSALPFSPSPPDTASRPMRSLPRRRGAATSSSTPSAKAKGKGRARKPVVEDEYEWTCPVVGCGRKHRSVRMTGDEQWIMAPNEGAISLFV